MSSLLCDCCQADSDSSGQPLAAVLACVPSFFNCNGRWMDLFLSIINRYWHFVYTAKVNFNRSDWSSAALNTIELSVVPGPVCGTQIDILLYSAFMLGFPKLLPENDCVLYSKFGDFMEN